MGRMGYPMAERLLKAGYDVSIWNRTRAKAEPLAKIGGKVVDKLSDLAGIDVLFSHRVRPARTWRRSIRQGRRRAGGKGKMPKIVVDCSTISVEESADIRETAEAARRRLRRLRRCPATPR